MTAHAYVMLVRCLSGLPPLLSSASCCRTCMTGTSATPSWWPRVRRTSGRTSPCTGRGWQTPMVYQKYTLTQNERDKYTPIYTHTLIHTYACSYMHTLKGKLICNSSTQASSYKGTQGQATQSASEFLSGVLLCDPCLEPALDCSVNHREPV